MAAIQAPDGNISEVEPALSEGGEFLLCVSTINPHKNYMTLVEAYAHLPEDTREDYPLVIAGRASDTTYAKHLGDRIDALDLGDHIHMLGEVPHAKMPLLYNAATLLVFPSHLETFGHPLVEAMASSLPIVASDASCIPEITGGAATLVDPQSPDAFATEIEALLNDPYRRKSQADRGFERAQDFSWERTVERMLDIFEAEG